MPSNLRGRALVSSESGDGRGGARRDSGPLIIREDPQRGVYVAGLSEHEVGSADEVLSLVHESATNRATCATSMNRSSSRSHALLLLRVEQSLPPRKSEDGGVAEEPRGRDGAIRTGLLSILDLAGSERVSK